ncbi:MAG: hypothetical protein JWR52_187 [Marmoricola sp.]|nr:hypothetical protein [Marmoricola sp.]
MVGYTSEGASDAQWFPNDPAAVWTAVKKYLSSMKLRSCDDRTMRLEVNLGMAAFTGSCIASVSVQPAPQGGALLRFSGRMGAFSGQNIGATRRIEKERTDLINSVASMLPAVMPPPASGAATDSDQLDVVGKLQQLSVLHQAGALSDDEYASAKAKLLA